MYNIKKDDDGRGAAQQLHKFRRPSSSGGSTQDSARLFPAVRLKCETTSVIGLGGRACCWTWPGHYQELRRRNTHTHNCLFKKRKEKRREEARTRNDAWAPPASHESLRGGGSRGMHSDSLQLLAKLEPGHSFVERLSLVIRARLSVCLSLIEINI